MFDINNLELIIIGSHVGLVILFLIFVAHIVKADSQKKNATVNSDSIEPAKSDAPSLATGVAAEEPVEAEEPIPAKPEKTSLEDGLKKTREGFFARIGSLLSKSESLEPDTMEQLEEALFTADIGVRTAEKLLDFIKETLNKDELGESEKIIEALKNHITGILNIKKPELAINGSKPFTIMVVGVNGVGKTTTIGKLAEKFRNDGHSTLLAAGDTFRAAAVEQLQIWANRSQADFSSGKAGADPSSVIFDGIKKAQQKNIDIVIADTAGRLHTKAPLMEELKKIRRVMNKASEGAPDEVWLVLDATTGQNAISQAQQFSEALEGVSGIIITKLDGTAKGGVIVGICEQFGVPVRYIGIGEQTEDLREFEPKDFVDALFAGE